MSVLIHATNIEGLGAVQVVRSLLRPLLERLQEEDVTVLVPSNEDFGVGNVHHERLHFRAFRRRLPNAISRLIESSFVGLRSYFADKYLVLGDIPLYGKEGQVVLVHNPNLISPEVNRFVSGERKYAILRWVFARNARFVKYFVVQSDVFKQELQATYTLPDEKVRVIPQTSPSWFDPKLVDPKKKIAGDKCIFFFPAVNSPHKNYEIFSKMRQALGDASQEFQIILTIERDELPPGLTDTRWIKPLGRLSTDACLELYRSVHGLFFPSLMETFGLPLVEAMCAGLPVVCADLPYAKWLCEDDGIYFDPLSGTSACSRLRETCDRLDQGWRPNWDQAIKKLPRNWDEVAQGFVQLLYG